MATGTGGKAAEGVAMLLEREAPLAELRRLHAEALGESGRLVFVEGEAGIGKTSLLAAFRAGLPEDMPSLLGTCDPLSTPRPLGPFVDVAEDLGPGLLGRLGEGSGGANLLPALLEALRGRPGLVLSLDDLHWADEATLDALRFIGRRITSTRVLVVGTYRDDEIGPDHPLRVVVGDLGTSPAVHRLPLTPLSQASVDALAAGSGIDPLELHRQTGGNPFFVTEVVAGSPARVPPTVRDAVLARAARLSTAARRTLEAAAVIGPVIEPGSLIRVVERVAADECLAGGLLVVRDGRYAFRHELAREAIYATTDPSTRIALHGRVLRAMEAGPERERTDAVLAHHAEAAGDHEAVLHYAVRAGRQAAEANAHREAAGQFARALRAAGGLHGRERATLLFEFAEKQLLIGRDDVAATALSEAAGIWRVMEQPADEARVLSRLAMAFVGAGRNDDGEAASRRALELAEGLAPGPERAQAFISQAWLRMLDRDNEEAIAQARRVLEAAEDASLSVLINAHNIIGSARILLDDAGGRDDLLEAIRIAETTGVGRGVIVSYGNLASAFGEMYRFDDAQPWLDVGIPFAYEHDLDGDHYLESWQSVIRAHQGRWREAESVAGTVLAAPTPAFSRVMALYALGRVKARRGDPDAWPILDEVLEVAAPTGTLQRVGPARAARAEAAWLMGDPERAADEAAAAIDLATRHRHPWHGGELTWWLRAGHRDAAVPSNVAEPWRLQLAGRPRDAAAAWARRGCPYESARALLESDAVDDVAEAHRIFDGLGAAPAIRLAQRRLRELGAPRIPRGRRPSTRDNPAGLTARELEILRLVAVGLPNGAIADRLVVSPRTVDHHVSSVLGKLGVVRRSDAAAAAVRLGLDLQDGQRSDPG